MKFINSARFMESSLSNNPAEEIHKIKCEDWNCFLEYKIVNDNVIKYKRLFCNKNYSNKIDVKLKKNDFGIYLSSLIIILINVFCC